MSGLKETLTVTPTREGDSYLANVPDVLLLRGENLKCYIYIEENDTGVTVYEIDIPVIPRAKPATSEYTPEKVATFDELVRRLNELIEQVEDMKVPTFSVNPQDGCLYSYTEE